MYAYVYIYIYVYMQARGGSSATRSATTAPRSRRSASCVAKRRIAPWARLRSAWSRACLLWMEICATRKEQAPKRQHIQNHYRSNQRNLNKHDKYVRLPAGRRIGGRGPGVHPRDLAAAHARLPVASAALSSFSSLSLSLLRLPLSLLLAVLLLLLCMFRSRPNPGGGRVSKRGRALIIGTTSLWTIKYWILACLFRSSRNRNRRMYASSYDPCVA